MKTLVKWIHSIWLATLLVVFGLLTIASAVSPVPTMVACDGQNQARNAYDEGLPSAFNYDSAAVCDANEKEIQTAGDGGFFADFAKFLAAKTVATPYGPAVQSMTADAQAALRQVQSGATVYKGGVLGRSETGASQFLALENPLNPGYAGRYGLPPQNANFEFITQKESSLGLDPGLTPFLGRTWH